METEIRITGLNLDYMLIKTRRKMGDLLTAFDVGKALGISGSSVVRYEKKGLLPKREMVGDRWYWRGSQLEQLRLALVPVKLPKRYPYRSQRITKKQEQQLLAMADAGVSQNELARRFPLSQPQICRVIRQLRELRDKA